MTPETVRRWTPNKQLLGGMEENCRGLYVMQPDYDALAAQARALARKMRSKNPFLETATVGYDTACDDILAALAMWVTQ